MDRDCDRTATDADDVAPSEPGLGFIKCISCSMLHTHTYHIFAIAIPREPRKAIERLKRNILAS